jgi:hypothetical protein
MAGLWSRHRKDLGHAQKSFKKADLSNHEPDFTEAEVISK